MADANQRFPFKRVLVTGGNGFLGKFVVAQLRALSKVEIFAPGKSRYDLINLADARRLLNDTQPDLIIHLAAVVGGIGANQKEPGRFFYENLIMGAHLMEEARLHDVRKFVAVGTVCAYPKLTKTPFREEDLWNGYPEETNAPYGLAKKMMLVQGQSYRQQYGFNSIFLLPANLYGPGDNCDPESSHVIPALIRKCIEARDSGELYVEAWGTGTASREFLYVDDCARAILLAAALYNEPAPLNIGTGSEITIRDLLGIIARLTNFQGQIRWQHDRPDGQPRRRLDISRALEKLGYKAETTLEEGLRITIDSYETTLASSQRAATNSQKQQ
ncbi:MAG: GDP-L-fucose synthase family protein [Pyrinomonadaceae bacterium]